MRHFLCWFGIVACCVGVSCKDNSAPLPGAANGPNALPEERVVKTWKLHTANEAQCRVKFPNGDPTETTVYNFMAPAFFRSGVNLSSEVYTRETGQNKSSRYGFIGTLLRPKAKPADFDYILTDLTKHIPPKEFTKGEPKTVTWGGLPATEVVATNATTEKWIVRHVKTTNGVYIAYIHDLGVLKPADIATYFDSFELLTKSKD